MRLIKTVVMCLKKKSHSKLHIAVLEMHPSPHGKEGELALECSGHKKSWYKLSFLKHASVTKVEIRTNHQTSTEEID